MQTDQLSSRHSAKSAKQSNFKYLVLIGIRWLLWGCTSAHSTQFEPHPAHRRDYFCNVLLTVHKT